ncbi:hypothetical protein ACFXGA_11390 [Actinosynnema sp. NPDC059335]|uniref:hypothetical protein n=1 Tax=Actinosynnema sp. NPDC059335 TaxID=3346804 RepID=UPI003671D967
MPTADGFPAGIVPPSGLPARIGFSADGVAWTTLATAGARQVRRGYYLYTAYVARPAPGYRRGVHDGHPTSAKPATSQVVHLVQPVTGSRAVRAPHSPSCGAWTRATGPGDEVLPPASDGPCPEGGLRR